MVIMNDRPSGPLVGLAYLLATPEALGSLCVIFMCSMSASPPRHSLWHTGQLVALGPPMRELCCWNTTRCCSSFFGGARSTDARRQTGRSFVRASPHQHHHHTTPCYTFVVKFFFFFFVRFVSYFRYFVVRLSRRESQRGQKMSRSEEIIEGGRFCTRGDERP